MRVLLPLVSAAAFAATMTASVSAQPEAANPRAEKEAARLAKALDGKVAGKPVSCISLRDIRSTKGYGERTMLYEVNRGLVYRNDPAGGCPMRDDRTIVTRTPGTQLCRGDIALVRDLTTGFDYGSCVLGDFVPYRPG